MQRLVIQESPVGGRGIFALCAFAPGDLIEICPVLVLEGKDKVHIEQTELYNYYFDWGGAGEQIAIGLGYASLYNHRALCNAYYDMRFETAELYIYCHRAIAIGEEIFINYNGEIDNSERVWFERDTDS